MSRTDAHRPYWVWLVDHPELVIEQHDHELGTCDFSHDVRDEVRSRRGGGTRCFRLLDPARGPRCSCPICSSSQACRTERRTTRMLERLICRRAVQGAEEVEIERLEGQLFDVEAW